MTKTKKTPKRARTREGAKATKSAATATRWTRTPDPRLPAPGTTITRRYKGRDLRVTVLDEGFRFEGETFRSLTAAALRATGYTHISGPHFWKTEGQETTTAKRATRKAKATATPDLAEQPAATAETA